MHNEWRIRTYMVQVLRRSAKHMQRKICLSGQSALRVQSSKGQAFETYPALACVFLDILLKKDAR